MNQDELVNDSIPSALCNGSFSDKKTTCFNTTLSNLAESLLSFKNSSTLFLFIYPNGKTNFANLTSISDIAVSDLTITYHPNFYPVDGSEIFPKLQLEFPKIPVQKRLIRVWENWEIEFKNSNSDIFIEIGSSTLFNPKQEFFSFYSLSFSSSISFYSFIPFLSIKRLIYQSNLPFLNLEDTCFHFFDQNQTSSLLLNYSFLKNVTILVFLNHPTLTITESISNYSIRIPVFSIFI